MSDYVNIYAPVSSIHQPLILILVLLFNAAKTVALNITLSTDHLHLLLTKGIQLQKALKSLQSTLECLDYTLFLAINEIVRQQAKLTKTTNKKGPQFIDYSILYPMHIYGIMSEI